MLRAELKHMFGEEQLSSLADYTQATTSPLPSCCATMDVRSVEPKHGKRICDVMVGIACGDSLRDALRPC